MSLKRDDDVEGTSLPAETTTTTTSSAAGESPGVFREEPQSPKMPLHSGLTALIQAATVQLGQVHDETCTTTPTQQLFRSSSPPTTTATPRYTPHGFHTTPLTTTTTLSFQDGCLPPSATSSSSCGTNANNKTSTPFSASSLNNTPTLGPELPLVPDNFRKQTFPEVLMTLLEDNANADVITFLPDGKYFAIRRKEFSETTMMNYFQVATFDDFLHKIHSWGFSRIERGVTPSAEKPTTTTLLSIEIFRHPMFVKGDWEKCSRICFGESPTEVRLSALPDRARIEYTLSDESTLPASKRRLSPSHARKDSETSKQRLVCGDDGDENLLLQFSRGSSELNGTSSTIPNVSKTESAETSSSSADASTNTLSMDATAAATNATIKMEDDVRSLALAITTEKLNLKTTASTDGEEDQAEALTPLVERAVENATHTIVTDAIETLLRDEGHTRETYLKHEQELSRSSLPGVVPISKQLFSPPEVRMSNSAHATVTTRSSSGNVDGEGQHQLPVLRNGTKGLPAETAILFEGIRTKSVARMSNDPSTTTSVVLTSNNNLGVVAISTSSST
jgi:HSF-type DNA-binding